METTAVSNFVCQGTYLPGITSNCTRKELINCTKETINDKFKSFVNINKNSFIIYKNLFSIA